ncbi:MAG TPA: serine/threonine-protein kinase [Kofleriaceae bacterium]|nr:serine/threonine-protein kinase [Kofleriaceae bacterium]
MRATETLRGGRARPPAPTPSGRLQAGDDVGHWTIVGQLAVGGCGAVYAARHRVLDRPAAIKVLHRELAANPAMVQRFVLEARAVNLIRHPNIIDVFDFGELPDGRPYFAMELLAADDLDRRIQTEGAFTPAEALALLSPVCLALAAAHAAGFVHRDLKARNVGFLPLPGGGEAVKLLDFGIAKLLEPDSPGAPATQRVGTLYAMAPEQILGQPVDRRTDVYALGVLLHHLVTGQVPFDDDDPLEVERMHLDAPPPPPSLVAPVSRAIDDLVGAAMAKSPSARPSGAEAFLEALRRAVNGPRAGRGALDHRAALAVHVTVGAAAGPDLDDAALDDMETSLALARGSLAEAGFDVVLDAATTLLGVAPLPASSAGRAAVRRAAVTAATRIEGAATTSVHIHTGEVELVAGAITGGPLLDTSGWLPDEPVAGVHITAAAAALEES